MKQYSFLLMLIAMVTLAGLTSCKKNNLAVDVEPLNVPLQAEFILNGQSIPFARTLNVQQTAPLDRITIPVGMTNLAANDRTIQFSYTSSTGAQNGVHFTAPTSIVIPAGKVVDSLRIIGNFSNLAAGVSHNLVIRISGGDVPGFTGKDSLTLTLRRFCPVVLNDLAGAYPNTRELFGTTAYGPYNTSISAITPLTATTARITVTNIYDFGWNPIDFILDYTAADPAQWTVEVVTQTSGIADAGTLDGAYSGMEVQVRPFANQPGTWDQCNQSLTLKMQLGVVGLGWFNSLYTVTMKRS